MSRVAIVYHFFAHYRGPIIEELKRSEEHEYYFVADTQDPLLSSGIKPYDFTEDPRFIRAPAKYVGPLLIQGRIVSLSIRKQFDCIIFLGNPKFLSTWIAVIAARLTGKKVMYWTHGWRKEDTGLRSLLKVMFFSIAQGMLFYGHRAKEISERKGFSRENQFVVYNSLDHSTQVTNRELLRNISEKDKASSCFQDPTLPVVAVVGRVTKTKRIDLLLEAAHQLGRENVKINILVIGGGPEIDQLDAYAKKLGLNVYFYGECYEERVLSKLIGTSHVCVVPGSVGLSAIHSMTYGTPVITHNNLDIQGPEYEAIKEGETGSLYEWENPQSLKAAIKTWISPDNDRELARRKCHEIVDTFYNPVFQRDAIDNAVNIVMS